MSDTVISVLMLTGVALTGGAPWEEILVNGMVLGEDGKWHGVWRREVGRGAVGSVGPECITTRTCKVSDQ